MATTPMPLSPAVATPLREEEVELGGHLGHEEGDEDTYGEEISVREFFVAHFRPVSIHDPVCGSLTFSDFISISSDLFNSCPFWPLSLVSRSLFHFFSSR